MTIRAYNGGVCRPADITIAIEVNDAQGVSRCSFDWSSAKTVIAFDMLAEIHDGMSSAAQELNKL